MAESVSMAAGLRGLALAAVFTWLAASCGGRSSEHRVQSNAGGDAAGGSESDGTGGRVGSGASGGTIGGRGGTDERGRGGASGGRGGATGGLGGSSGAPGGETHGGASDGGAGVGGAGETGAGETGVGGAAAGRGGMAGSSGQPRLGVCDSSGVFSENLESCGVDFVHRPVALGCTPPPRDGTIEGIGGNIGEEDLSECMNADDCEVVADCARDDDCGSGAYCIREVWNDDVRTIYYHFCFTPCQSDADCANDSLCACDYRLRNATRLPAQFGMCVPADCRTDADCEGDSLCVDVFRRRVRWARGSTFHGFHCQTPADECYSSPRCPTPPDLEDCCAVAACLYVEDRFVCGGVDTCNLC